MAVDGDEPRLGILRQHARLRTGAAADVENASVRPDTGHERKRLQRARRITRSLPRQTAEQLEEERRFVRHRKKKRPGDNARPCLKVMSSS